MGEGSKRGADCGVSQLLVLFRAPQGRRENIEWKLSAKPNLPRTPDNRWGGQEADPANFGAF